MEGYNNLDQILHLLSQVLAKASANLIPEEIDYSHTNLQLDPIEKRIFSRWIYSGKNKYCLVLNLKYFSFEWLDSEFQQVDTLKINGKTIDEIEKDVLASWTRKFDVDQKFETSLKYEMPDYSFAKVPFETITEHQLSSWLIIRSLANYSCEKFLKYLNAFHEVRIWPHHFDTGVYSEVNEDLGLGFGLAMKDELVGDSYFYISGYGLTKELQLKNLPILTDGEWKNNDWKGAVLPLSPLKQLSIQNQIEKINKFVLETSRWYISKT